MSLNFEMRIWSWTCSCVDQFLIFAIAGAVLLVGPNPITAQEGSQHKAEGEVRILTPAEQRADIRQWYDQVKQFHPGVFRWTSQEQMDRAVADALEASSRDRDVLQFWRALSRLNAMIRCGHAPLNLPRDLYQVVLHNESTVPPINVKVLEGQLFITSSIGEFNPLTGGDRVISINGHPFEKMLEELNASLHADGQNATVKIRDIESKFAPFYRLFIDSESINLTLVVERTDGTQKTVVTKGALFSEWRKGQHPGSRPEPFAFSIQDGVGILKLRTLSDGAFDGKRRNLDKLMSDACQQLADAKVDKLVLDLRGLSGGSDMLVVSVLQFLMDQPFRIFDRIEVANGYVAPEGGNGRGEVVTDQQGRRVVKNHPGLVVTEPHKNRFRGRLAVLTDGLTFSAGADLAATLHRTSRATFYGEETGGGYAGNTSGPGELLKLNHSGIQLPVRQWTYYTYKVDSSKYPGGVPPHVAVSPSIEDVLAGKDRVLFAAVEDLGGRAKD